MEVDFQVLIGAKKEEEEDEEEVSGAHILITFIVIISGYKPHNECHVSRRKSLVSILGIITINKQLQCKKHARKKHIKTRKKKKKKQRVAQKSTSMAASMMSSVSLKPAAFSFEKSSVRGVPSLARSTSSLKVRAGGKKIKTDKPYGINGGMDLRDGLDASGRKGKGKGVYQFVDKYGANVDGYSPIYDTRDWSPGGDVYVGGSTGLAIWAVTLAGLLAGGALLVYNTSALAQ